jgi:hypothetical protein
LLHHKLVDEPEEQSGSVPRTAWREPYLILLKQPIPFPESPQFASGDRSPDSPLPKNEVLFSHDGLPRSVTRRNQPPTWRRA